MKTRILIIILAVLLPKLAEACSLCNYTVLVKTWPDMHQTYATFNADPTNHMKVKVTVDYLPPWPGCSISIVNGSRSEYAYGYSATMEFASEGNYPINVYFSFAGSTPFPYTFKARRPWRNMPSNLDANYDGSITPDDVLAVTNWVNSHPNWTLPVIGAKPIGAAAVDVNGDGLCSPIDVLTIVSAYNATLGFAVSTWDFSPVYGSRSCIDGKAQMTMRLTFSPGSVTNIGLYAMRIDGGPWVPFTSSSISKNMGSFSPGKHVAEIAYGATTIKAKAFQVPDLDLTVLPMIMQATTPNSYVRLPNGNTRVTFEVVPTPVFSMDPLGTGVIWPTYSSYGWAVDYQPVNCTSSLLTYEFTPGTHLLQAKVTGSYCWASKTGYTDRSWLFFKAPEPTDVPAEQNISISSLSDSRCRIAFPGNAEGDARILLCDILGRVIVNETVRMHAGNFHDIPLSTMNIPTGMYLVRVDAQDMHATKKIAKQ
jgi:hypothetical protein